MPKDNAAAANLRVSVGQFSTAGRKPGNQDFHGAVLPTGPTLRSKGVTLAIADGISSSAVSGEAAETAVKSLLTDYYATPDSWTVRTSAARVIAATNAWLHTRNNTLSDMDTGQVCTLSALIVKGRSAHILHVGDAAIMRLTRSGLEPLTREHRIVMSERKTYLGRALGAEPQVKIDYRQVSTAIGEVFVLFTDGVHEHIRAEDVRTALASADLDSAARMLADTALANGSDDNLTIQFVRIDGLPGGKTEDAPDLCDLPVPPTPKPGDVLDGFRIVRQIHATPRSNVFLATDPDGKKVALKIPASDIVSDNDAFQRFAIEEWIASRASSPHVIAAAPRPVASTWLFIVTEWVAGRTLRQWMIDNPNPPREIVRDVIGQIAAGLRALHRRQMIHQDLRPDNIMIDSDGTVKIIDLGSVSVAGLQETTPGLAGEQPGTFQFTAPEYLSGDTVSWRSDQYALGAIAYEMLTGRLPYGADVSRIQSRADQRKLCYRSASDDKSGVPNWMDAALRRAVHPDPLRRYDALSEFVANLKRPSEHWRPKDHLPLAERDPVRFWQCTTLALAILTIFLAAR